MSGRKILIISGGASEQSSTTMLASRIGRATVDEEPGGATLDIIELRDLAADIASGVATGMVSPKLQNAIDKVSSAEAVIAATPVYKAGYAGLFKAFFDLVDDDALLGTPVTLAATAGTPRHSLIPDQAMRPLFAYFNAIVTPTSVFAATEDWSTPAISERTARAAKELSALVRSGIRQSIRGTSGDSYRRTFARTSGSGGGDDSGGPEDGLNFDSDLMRLATGGK